MLEPVTGSLGSALAPRESGASGVSAYILWVGDRGHDDGVDGGQRGMGHCKLLEAGSLLPGCYMCADDLTREALAQLLEVRVRVGVRVEAGRGQGQRLWYGELTGGTFVTKSDVILMLTHT